MLFVIAELPFIKCNVETSSPGVKKQVSLFHCVALHPVIDNGNMSNKPDILLFCGKFTVAHTVLFKGGHQHVGHFYW